uniref:Bradykinin-potentiating peptide 7b n=1 Tax=Bothrops cotiara TaxID=8727 RepID=BPP7B_BOTCO|nr:RecName: Full=Bradykinin-potentiating peptide 7b; Short=BPP-7b [Bothrops cotiara]
QNWPSPK